MLSRTSIIRPKDALRKIAVSLLLIACSCSSTSERSNDPRSSNLGGVVFGSRTEFEGRYRFKTRISDNKEQYKGWWGEMLITRDRMLRIYRQSESSELVVDYGRISNLQPTLIEYRIMHGYPQNQITKYTNGIENYQVQLDTGSALILKSQTKSGETIEEWIPVGLAP
jgi:hypothetical protein